MIFWGRAGNVEGDEDQLVEEPTLLKALLRVRHWQKRETFPASGTASRKHLTPRSPEPAPRMRNSIDGSGVTFAACPILTRAGSWRKCSQVSRFSNFFNPREQREVSCGTTPSPAARHGK
jgi:hypothetical protein